MNGDFFTPQQLQVLRSLGMNTATSRFAGAYWLTGGPSRFGRVIYVGSFNGTWVVRSPVTTIPRSRQNYVCFYAAYDSFETLCAALALGAIHV
jgi:hypothetical protein